MFTNTSNLPRKELCDGISANVVWGEKITLSFADCNPYSTLPPHSHPHEQMGVVLSGKCEFTIAEESKLLQEGDVFLVPSGVEHSAKFLESQTRILDIFSPPREDFK